MSQIFNSFALTDFAEILILLNYVIPTSNVNGYSQPTPYISLIHNSHLNEKCYLLLSLESSMTKLFKIGTPLKC